jgi:Cu/Zn superoxide dismutase
LTSLSDLVGRALVIHGNKDSGAGANCDASGSSGPRIALGVIGIPNPATTIVALPVDLVIDNEWLPTDCTPVGPPPPSGYSAHAVATLTGQSGEEISGTVDFYEYSDRVVVLVNVTGLGLDRSLVGIHVHEFGDLSSVGMEDKGLSTGTHYIGRWEGRTGRQEIVGEGKGKRRGGEGRGGEGKWKGRRKVEIGRPKAEGRRKAGGRQA